MNSVAEEKSNLRARIRALLGSWSLARWSESSRDACTRLLGVSELAGVGGVLFFAPTQTGQEVDPRQAARAMLASGRIIALPRVGWDDGTLTPVRVNSVDAGLVTRRHAIPEPPDAALVLEPGELEVVIVPGVAFDSLGGRLGRGGGFYDRFLSGLDSRVFAVGLALDEQVVERVPREPHDTRVHAVVTPTRVIRCNATGG